MKNIVIILLVVVIGVLGYFQFVKDDGTLNSSTNNTTSTSSSTEKQTASNGKTLDLSNKGLNDVSHDILDDSTVTTINLSGNNLTGALPAEIRKLTNLEVIDASDNNMTGIPAEIGQLSKLRIANFANNNISGLPMEIGNLKNLETFDLRGNPNVSQQDLSQIKLKLPNATFLTN